MKNERWDYGAVALLDILGFSDFVEIDAASQEPEHLSRLVACLREARASQAAGQLDIRAFSDSIIVSGELSTEVIASIIEFVANLQKLFCNQGVLIRGAMALGKHYADRDSIYSEALVRAYKLEKDHARFPRIIIDPNLLDWLLNESSLTEQTRTKICKQVMRDRDGHAFIHYLDNDSLATNKILIESFSLQKLSASVLEKLQWLVTYHNFVSSLINPKTTITNPLADVFQPLCKPRSLGEHGVA